MLQRRTSTLRSFISHRGRRVLRVLLISHPSSLKVRRGKTLLRLATQRQAGLTQTFKEVHFTKRFDLSVTSEGSV